MKFVLSELLVDLEILRSKGTSLLGQVDASHPDADQVNNAIAHIREAIDSLKKIGFGLESETSYDD